MKANISQPQCYVFTAEAGETDASNARAIAQAVFELSRFEEMPDTGGVVPWMDELFIAAHHQPRRSALSTPCLEIKRFFSKLLNLELMYGGENELLLLTTNLNMPHAAVPFVAKRAQDLAICFRQEVRGHSLTEFFQGRFLRDRLACHSIAPRPDPTDWALRRQAFRQLITSGGPEGFLAIEYLLGCFTHETERSEYDRMNRLSEAAIEVRRSSGDLARIADEVLAEYQQDPLVIRQRRGKAANN